MPNPSPRDAKAVAKAIADPRVAAALLGLVERGCDETSSASTMTLHVGQRAIVTPGQRR